MHTMVQSSGLLLKKEQTYVVNIISNEKHCFPMVSRKPNRFHNALVFLPSDPIRSDPIQGSKARSLIS